VPAVGINTPDIIKVRQRISHGTELVSHPEVRKLRNCETLLIASEDELTSTDVKMGMASRDQLLRSQNRDGRCNNRKGSVTMTQKNTIHSSGQVVESMCGSKSPEKDSMKA
jgi:hypothetical protein